MNCEVISIGDELLIGQTVNTNASWLGGQLNLLGYDINYGSVISDLGQCLFNPDPSPCSHSRAPATIVTMYNDLRLIPMWSALSVYMIECKSLTT